MVRTDGLSRALSHKMSEIEVSSSTARLAAREQRATRTRRSNRLFYRGSAWRLFPLCERGGAALLDGERE